MQSRHVVLATFFAAALSLGAAAPGRAAAPQSEQIQLFTKADAYTRHKDYRDACQAYAQLERATDEFSAVSPKIVGAVRPLGNGPHNVLDMTKSRIEEGRYDAACVNAFLSAIVMSEFESPQQNRFISLAHRIAGLGKIPLQRPPASSVAVQPVQAPRASAPRGGDAPPVGTYACYTGASAAFINPRGGMGTQEGTGLRFTPGQFNGYVYIMPGNRYAAGYSEADKAHAAGYHMEGAMLVAESGYWSTNAIVRYDTSQGTPTIFVGYKGVEGVNGCQLR